MKQSALIKELRGKLTQKEFSEIVGEKQSLISMAETEARAISLKKFLSWCEKLGATLHLKK